jgi:hypothetical protein
VTTPADRPARQALAGGHGPSIEAELRAGEPAQAVRSAGCTCQASPGAPCGPSGHHPARYLNAERAGAITRASLAEVIAGLDVIAPHVLIQPPGERAARAEVSPREARELEISNPRDLSGPQPAAGPVPMTGAAARTAEPGRLPTRASGWEAEIG